MHQGWFTLDAHRLRRVFHGGTEVADLIDQLERQRLFTGPDLAIGQGEHLVVFHFAPDRHAVNELRVHIVDQALHVHPLGGRHLARRRAGVLELARLQRDLLKFGPLQQFLIVVPLGDDADGAHDTGIVGEDLAGRRRDVIGPAGAYGLNGSHHRLLVLVADPQNLAIDFLGGRRSAAGRVHVDDDRLDGAVIGKLVQLLDDLLGIDDDAFQVDHADLVAKAAEAVFLLRADGEVDQGKDSDEEEEEGSSAE